MGRTVKITITNLTVYEFYDYSHQTSDSHGKFITDPADTVGIRKKMTFEVGNNTGAKIGPKGAISYRLKGFYDEEARIVFSWNHPFSAATSSYECYLKDSVDSVTCLQPSAPYDGHHQSVVFEVTAINIRNSNNSNINKNESLKRDASPK